MAFSCSWCSRTLRDHHASIVCNGYCSWRCNTEVENQQKQRRAELKERQKSGGGCFITAAACDAVGLQDDCRELRVLRHFRDGFMVETPGRVSLVTHYYATAPVILASIEADGERARILRALFEDTITPAVDAIERGELAQALAMYEAMMRTLETRHLV